MRENEADMSNPLQNISESRNNTWKKAISGRVSTEKDHI